jgi:hypothetical protein
MPPFAFTARILENITVRASLKNTDTAVRVNGVEMQQTAYLTVRSAVGQASACSGLQPNVI